MSEVFVVNCYRPSAENASVINSGPYKGKLSHCHDDDQEFPSFTLGVYTTEEQARHDLNEYQQKAIAKFRETEAEGSAPDLVPLVYADIYRYKVDSVLDCTFTQSVSFEDDWA
jgi:hypothetical protein